MESPMREYDRNIKQLKHRIAILEDLINQEKIRCDNIARSKHHIKEVILYKEDRNFEELKIIDILETKEGLRIYVKRRGNNPQ